MRELFSVFTVVTRGRHCSVPDLCRSPPPAELGRGAGWARRPPRSLKPLAELGVELGRTTSDYTVLFVRI